MSVSEMERDLIIAVRARNWEGMNVILHVIKSMYTPSSAEFDIKSLDLTVRTKNALLRNAYPIWQDLGKTEKIKSNDYKELTTTEVLQVAQTGRLRLMRNIGNKAIAEFLDVCGELGLISQAEAYDLYILNKDYQ